MLPSLNLNPSFANLAALHGLGGGFPHSVRPIGTPIYQAPVGAPMTSPMPGQALGQMPMQAPQGNLANLRALMQLLGQRPSQL